jgi:adenylosuccinate synthase
MFKTEDLGEVGRTLQDIGQEFGVSTGRKRRCGHLDLVALKYSASVNHYSAWNLTKLDVLDTLPVIKIAVAYKDRETGEELDYFPADLGSLERCDVVYRDFEGWQTPTTAVKKFVCIFLIPRIVPRGIWLTLNRRICRHKRRPTSSSSRKPPAYAWRG